VCRGLGYVVGYVVGSGAKHIWRLP